MPFVFIPRINCHFFAIFQIVRWAFEHHLFYCRAQRKMLISTMKQCNGKFRTKINRYVNRGTRRCSRETCILINEKELPKDRTLIYCDFCTRTPYTALGPTQHACGITNQFLMLSKLEKWNVSPSEFNRRPLFYTKVPDVQTVQLACLCGTRGASPCSRFLLIDCHSSVRTEVSYIYVCQISLCHRSHIVEFKFHFPFQ